MSYLTDDEKAIAEKGMTLVDAAYEAIASESWRSLILAGYWLEWHIYMQGWVQGWVWSPTPALLEEWERAATEKAKGAPKNPFLRDVSRQDAT